MKQIFAALLMFIASLPVVRGQAPDVDSLNKLLNRTVEDTNKVLLLIEIAGNYQFFNSDTAILLLGEALDLSRKLNFTEGEVKAISRQGEVRHGRGELPEALETELTAVQLSRKYNYPEVEAESLTFLAVIYLDLGEYRQALNYLFQAKKIYDIIAGQLSPGIAQNFPSFVFSNMGEAYEKLNMIDSALYFQKMALRYPKGYGGYALSLGRMGTIQSHLHRYNEALAYFRQVLNITDKSNDLLNRSSAQYQMAEIFNLQRNSDSALHYARMAYKNAEQSLQKTALLDASSLLVRLYQTKGNADSAFYYQQIAMKTRDSLFGLDKFQKLQLLALSEQQRVQQLKEEQVLSQARVQRTILFFSIGVFLLIGVILWYTNRRQRKANLLLNDKNLQIEKQSESLKKTLNELRSTQAQLIQQEKMASLGELTAGIAHEIQNPLNFVNNFSEVNNELIEEMNNESNIDEIKAIGNDIKQNNERIAFHGKRADAIVKSMLEHSRASTGVKEPTDINKLADEYLKLAYHGMRAKDKSFEVDIKTDFEESIGKINVVPQDIGRVLLNLYNNAFYACAEQSRSAMTEKHPAIVNEEKSEKNNLYQPAVWVTTKREGNSVAITVRDNGSGIPDSVKEKIFQPFFTTKPTGEGTGLGLSLSYDIIKVHGGEIRVETKKEEGTTFIVQLPF